MKVNFDWRNGCPVMQLFCENTYDNCFIEMLFNNYMQSTQLPFMLEFFKYMDIPDRSVE